MAGLLEPISQMIHPDIQGKLRREIMEAASREQGNFLKGRLTGPFTGAPDLLGITRNLSTNPMSMLPGKQTHSIVPEDFSGQPIRGLFGIDESSPAGMFGEALGLENAMTKTGNFVARAAKAALANPKTAMAVAPLLAIPKSIKEAEILTTVAGKRRAADQPRVNFPEGGPQPKAKARTEFSGAPKKSTLLGGRGVESAADEDAILEHYLSQAEGGALGRLWYDRAAARVGRDVGNSTGARPGVADQQSAVIGDFSAGTAVEQNRLAQVRANNQFQTGRPVAAATTNRNKGAQEILQNSTINPETSLKTGLFGMQVRGMPVPRGVHDFRDAINWGFPFKNSEEAGAGIGVAQHRWMDGMADRAVKLANERKLGGFDDWTHDRLQAAGWVKQKADSKGIPVSALENEFGPADEWLIANVFSEATPSSELVQLGKMDETSKSVNTALHQGRFANPEGQDALAQQLGLLSPQSVMARGEWKGTLSPNIVTRIMADPGIGVDTISDWSSEAVAFHASLRGILGGQADVATSFFRKPKKAGDINSAVVPFSRAVTNADLLSTQSALVKVMRDNNVPGKPMVNFRGGDDLEVTWLEPDGATLKERKGFRAAVDTVTGGRATQARNSGGLLTFSDEFKPSAYLENLQNPVLRGKVETMLPQIAGDIAKDIERLPLTKRGKEVYQKTVELIRDGGLAAVEEAVKKGALPAVILGAFVLGANQVPQQHAAEQGLLQPSI